MDDTPSATPPKAILLDRDGVLNQERGFIHGPDELEPMEGVQDALGAWKERGYLLLVVSNQSGLARRLYSFDDLCQIHAKLRGYCGGLLDAIYVCPHHPEEGDPPLQRDCPCRKPRSGMLAQALREWGLKPERCLLLGDAPRDLVAAHNLGIQAAVLMGHKLPSKDHWPVDHGPLPEFLPDLKAAVAWTDKVMADA